MSKSLCQVFIGFSAKDRYSIVEPLVYHLKNYGINVWYDRYTILVSDNRIQKNIIEGVYGCKYAIVIISENTCQSVCAMEELSIIHTRYSHGEVTVFPILYEISPNSIVEDLSWVKKIIFKEVTCSSGTREVCNHIACKITGDILEEHRYKKISDIQEKASHIATFNLHTYRDISKHRLQ